jgi:hypothetical protein
VQFAGGVTALQLTLMLLEDAAVADELPGEEGTVVQEPPFPLVVTNVVMLWAGSA